MLSTHVLSVMCLNSEPTLYRAGCEYDESSHQHQCKLLPFLSAKDQEGDAQSFDLSVTARNPILPSVTSVEMTLTFKSICSGKETPPQSVSKVSTSIYLDI